MMSDDVKDRWPTGDPDTDGRKRLTLDEIDRIVELRLNQVPVRQVAQEVGCSPQTVTRHWHNWLDDQSTDRNQRLERRRAECIARIESVAVSSRRAAIRARGDVRTQPDGSTVVVVPPDMAAERGALRTELRALVDLARVAGYEAPKVLQLAPSRQPTVDEARATLSEFAEAAGVDVDGLLAMLGAIDDDG